MIKLNKDNFRERIIRSQERRKIGRREATNHTNENWHKTREHAYSARHANQSAY